MVRIPSEHDDLSQEPMGFDIHNKKEVREAKHLIRGDTLLHRISAEIMDAEDVVIDGDLVYSESAGEWLDELEEFVIKWVEDFQPAQYDTLSAIDAVKQFVSEHPPKKTDKKIACKRLLWFLKTHG